jgi:anti-sigma factor RsiW
MTVSPKIPTDRDLELLSAYLDDELTDREKEMLEQRLARENALRAELDDLRETVALVSDLPRLKAPRNFTLDPAVYGRPVRQRLFTLAFALRFSGALGAAASIVLIMLAVLLTQGGSEKSSLSSEHQSAESPQVAMQPTVADAQAEETALAYAGNDLLQTTMAAQSLYYATLEPTLTQAALGMAAPAGEETNQDQNATTAPTEMAQEMAAGAVAPAESEAPLAPPANEEPSTLMVQPGAYPPAAAQDAVGGAAPPPAPASTPTATAAPVSAAPQEAASPSEGGFRESDRDDNTDEGATDGAAANVAPSLPTSPAEAMVLPTAPPAPATQAEKSQPDETPVEAQTVRRQTTSEGSSSYWWLAGIGLVTLAASVALFVWGGRITRA